MNKKKLYIGISILILILIGALLAWALFVGKQQRELREGGRELDFYDSIPNNFSNSGGGFFGNVFNDGVRDTETKSQEVPEDKVNLIQLYNLPVAGFIKQSAAAVRLVDRATGHIFEKELVDGTTTRIDQTTVPQVYKALFVNDGNGVIRQYLNKEKQIISIYSDLTEEEQESFALPVNTYKLDANKSSDKIAYISRRSNGSVVSIANSNGSEQTDVFTSALFDWDLEWGEESIILTQKASSKAVGSSYLINAETGVRKLLLQQLKGLSTNISPDDIFVLYSAFTNKDIPILFIQNIDTDIHSSLNLVSFSEKCVWHPNSEKIFCAVPNNFPEKGNIDSWYRGEIHFNDSLWEIDVETGLVTHLVSPSSEYGISLDMTQLSTNKEGSSIFFINKTDQTLWVINLPENNAG